MGERRMVALTLEPGAREERGAQVEKVNASQLFPWRRAFLRELSEAASSTLLLPVVVYFVTFISCGPGPLPVQRVEMQ